MQEQATRSLFFYQKIFYLDILVSTHSTLMIQMLIQSCKQVLIDIIFWFTTLLKKNPIQRRYLLSLSYIRFILTHAIHFTIFIFPRLSR